MSYTAAIALRSIYAATLLPSGNYSATAAIRSVYTATMALLETDMANYILNRYDLTGLTGGTPSKLDGMSAATLGGLVSGARLQMGLAGGIVAQFRLDALGSDVESAPWIIVCDNDAMRCWRLEFVMREGQPCSWNIDSGKFHRIWGVGADGAAVPSMDESGFSLPL